MYTTICVLIGLTVVIAAFRLAPRLAEGRVVFDQTPDKPAPFGYRMAWLAIRTSNAAQVAEALGVNALQHANWRTGRPVIAAAVGPWLCRQDDAAAARSRRQIP